MMSFLSSLPISLSSLPAAVPPSCGAAVSFEGIVRDHHEGRASQRLYYDCCTELAEAELGRIIEQARSEFKVERIDLLHRTGWLEIGDIAVVIRVLAGHRAEAFAACEAIIDRLKDSVPIWKKEIYADHQAAWHGDPQGRQS